VKELNYRVADAAVKCLADVGIGHGVVFFVDTDETAGGDLTSLKSPETRRTKRHFLHLGPLFRPALPGGIALFDNLIHEIGEILLRGEIATVAQHQLCLQVTAKMSVTDLCTAIFIRTADIDRPGLQRVVIKQALKTFIENPVLPIAMSHYRRVVQLQPRRQSAAAMKHQFVNHCFQGCKTLRITECYILMRRMGEDGMAEQFLVVLAGNADFDFQGCPVDLHPLCRLVNLLEINLLAFEPGLHFPDPTLQSAKL